MTLSSGDGHNAPRRGRRANFTEEQWAERQRGLHRARSDRWRRARRGDDTVVAQLADSLAVPAAAPAPLPADAVVTAVGSMAATTSLSPSAEPSRSVTRAASRAARGEKSPAERAALEAEIRRAIFVPGPTGEPQPVLDLRNPILHAMYRHAHDTVVKNMRKRQRRATRRALAAIKRGATGSSDSDASSDVDDRTRSSESSSTDADSDDGISGSSAAASARGPPTSGRKRKRVSRPRMARSTATNK